MENNFLKFFGGNIFVINLRRRSDRLANFQRQMDLIGIRDWKRFEAIDAGPDDGNRGCTSSHRTLLGQIAAAGLERAFIFEDDSVLRPEFVDTFNDEVLAPLRELPKDFDVCYLGAGYGDDPQGWHSKHLVRVNAMKTTSSYGVSLKAAKALYEYIPADTCDAIDNFFSGWTPSHQCFVSEPRFFMQYKNYSDLQKAVLDNGMSMCDSGHISRLGKFKS